MISSLSPRPSQSLLFQHNTKPSTKVEASAQRSGAFCSIYQDDMLKFMDAVNPEARKSVSLVEKDGQLFGSMDEIVQQILVELNNLSKRSFNMVNVPHEKPCTYDGVVDDLPINVYVREEEIHHPLNHENKRGAFSMALMPSSLHPENVVRFVTTAPLGGIENLHNKAVPRDDGTINMALLKKIAPAIKNSHLDTVLPEDIFDYNHYVKYNPEGQAK